MRFNQKPRSSLIWLIILVAIFFVIPIIGPAQVRIFSAAEAAPSFSHIVVNPQSSRPNYIVTLSAPTKTGQGVSLQPISTSPLTYHGGPVQHIQYAYAIFWLPVGDHFEPGPSPNDSRFESLVSRYFDDVSGSNLSKLMVQYPDSLNASPTSEVVFGGGFVDTTPYPHVGNLTDPLLGSDVSNEVEKVISSGALPTGVDDSYYVFTANGINVCEDSGMTLCTFTTTQLPSGLCAFHSYLPSDSPFAFVAVNPSGMSGACQVSVSGVITYPNDDQTSDSAINLASQQQLDMQSDPFGNSWYDTTTNGEISDKCIGEYGSVNVTSGNNTVLNGNPYLLQEEWSNSAGSCTLTPPVTASVQVTLAPYGGSNSLTPTNYFPLTYAIGKQLFVFDYTTYPITINADPNTSLSIGPMSSNSNSGSEKWCLDSSCSGSVTDLGNGIGPISLSYYDLLEQNVYEATSDNSQPTTFASMSFTTAPTVMGNPPSAAIVNLTSYSQYVWMLRGTEASASSESYPVSPTTQRWVNTGGEWQVTQPFQIPLIISYHQFAIDFGFSVIPPNTAALVGPNVTYVSSGENTSATISETGTTLWADSGSTYAYESELQSSSQSEHWVAISGSGTGKASGPATVNNLYYNQFLVTASYESATSGTGSSFSPLFTYQSFGSNLSSSLGATPQTFWIDANSTYVITNQLPGSNSTDRWISTETGTGIIYESTSLLFRYYHQYAINFSYTIVGGGTPSVLPVVNYTSFNGTASLQLSNSLSPVWVNAGSLFNVSSSMSAPNSTERWAYNSGSLNASAPGNATITLYHQYLVSFSVGILGGGSPTTLPTISAVNFSEPISVTVNASAVTANSTVPATTYWLDAGSTYSLPTTLLSTSSERILALTQPSGVVNSSQIVSVRYYTQDLITLGYSVTNGADPSGGPSASLVQFGTPETVTVNQTSGQAWADSGSSAALPSQLPGSNSGERWATNSTFSGTVVAGLSLNPSYDHQFYVTLSTNPQSVPVVLSESTGWYDSGSSLVVTQIAGKGWHFEGWNGTGIGAYSGSLSNLLITVTSPVTETATYYTALSVTAPSTGSVTYSYGQTVGTIKGGQTEVVYVPPNQELSMSATPFPVFYSFSDWSGNLTGGPNATKVVQNPFTFTVSGPTSVSAGFKINLIGIIVVAVVIVIAVASVFMLRLRNRPQRDEYAEELPGDEGLEAIEEAEGSQ